MLDVAAVARDAGVAARVLRGHVMDHQGAVLEDVHPGSQLGGVQDAILALPLNERLGVPLGLAPQQGCVALVHRSALRLHLEGDEHCHSELDVGADLALQPIGGDAGVVASVVTGHPGEVQGPGVVCHPLREAAPICPDPLNSGLFPACG